ncbi:hypothetical protein GCM10009584_18050 [Ornithinimicrobium humiphilum]|uniref:AtuA-like ferredoxin-fold domain-containing protein n=1 Tax=Ornithinimicrobium humiphilum TaxID=125288 RepID=A0A543KLF5_9MICO|nr:hypothetical protein [Ornithinimicrobium humiphilum]TQM95897.1 hypothetical protein FB476_0747 [Ornithinimicrobium humiphilum]
MSPSRILDDVADVRTGDKGDTLVVAVVVRDPGDYETVLRALSPGRVATHFGELLTGEISRTELPQLEAVVLLLPGVLGGGVTGAPVLDGHGKTLSSYVAMLALD